MRAALALVLLLASAPAHALSLGSTLGGAGSLGQGSTNSTKVLYVVRTWHTNYETRLRAVLRTWAAPLAKESLLIVGDEPHPNISMLVNEKCNEFHGHHEGLCCKTADAIAHAVKERPDWDWLFMADDDHYVMTGNMEKVLSRHDPSKVMAVGALGCALNNCSKEYDHVGRICGGGGYALSRAGAAALVGESRDSFMKQHMDMSREFNGQEDVATTCMLRRKQIDLVHLRGTYGWRLAPPHNDGHGHQVPYIENLPDSMLAPFFKADPIPVIFHYLSPAEIDAYHRHVARLREQQSLLSVAARTTRKRHLSYDEQFRQYVEASVGRSTLADFVPVL